MRVSCTVYLNFSIDNVWNDKSLYTQSRYFLFRNAVVLGDNVLPIHAHACMNSWIFYDRMQWTYDACILKLRTSNLEFNEKK